MSQGIKGSNPFPTLWVIAVLFLSVLAGKPLTAYTDEQCGKMMNDTIKIPKPGQLTNTLDWRTLDLVYAHPAQKNTHAIIRKLISMLRKCETPEDYYNFQKHLFQFIYEADARRGECNRALKRLKAGKTADTSSPPSGLVQDEADDWRLELFVYERISRQLRSVGDALAWQRFNYDRRLILTISRNAQPGTINNKVGLNYELGRIEDIWKDSGHFALLHDLTNCLRMGDVSEFTADGGVLFHEVKKDPKHVDKVQVRRIQQAIDALAKGGKLPGHQEDARITELKVRYKTDLKKLQDLLALTRRHGFKGMKLSGGRALMALSLSRTFELYKDSYESTSERYSSERSSAIKRAGIGQVKHQLLGNGRDTAARAPYIAPWAIYPFSEEDCADLICDLIMFESVVSADHLALALRELGLGVEIKLPEERGRERSPDEDVLRATWRDRGLTLHGGGLNILLYELVQPVTWAEGVRELLTAKDPPQSPVVMFSDEERVWWQPRKKYKPKRNDFHSK